MRSSQLLKGRFSREESFTGPTILVSPENPLKQKTRRTSPKTETKPTRRRNSCQEQRHGGAWSTYPRVVELRHHQLRWLAAEIDHPTSLPLSTLNIPLPHSISLPSHSWPCCLRCAYTQASACSTPSARRPRGGHPAREAGRKLSGSACSVVVPVVVAGQTLQKTGFSPSYLHQNLQKTRKPCSAPVVPKWSVKNPQKTKFAPIIFAYLGAPFAKLVSSK